MLDLRSDLPDDTLLEMVRFPTRIRKAIAYAGVKTMGELRQMTDEALFSIPDLGKGSIKWLRRRLTPVVRVHRG